MKRRIYETPKSMIQILTKYPNINCSNNTKQVATKNCTNNRIKNAKRLKTLIVREDYLIYLALFIFGRVSTRFPLTSYFSTRLIRQPLYPPSNIISVSLQKKLQSDIITIAHLQGPEGTQQETRPLFLLRQQF